MGYWNKAICLNKKMKDQCQNCTTKQRSIIVRWLMTQNEIISKTKFVILTVALMLCGVLFPESLTIKTVMIST